MRADVCIHAQARGFVELDEKFQKVAAQAQDYMELAARELNDETWKKNKDVAHQGRELHCRKTRFSTRVQARTIIGYGQNVTIFDFDRHFHGAVSLLFWFSVRFAQFCAPAHTPVTSIIAPKLKEI